eukprot:1299528-Prymnesium_polylepis.1
MPGCICVDYTATYYLLPTYNNSNAGDSPHKSHTLPTTSACWHACDTHTHTCNLHLHTYTYTPTTPTCLTQKARPKETYVGSHVQGKPT